MRWLKTNALGVNKGSHVIRPVHTVTMLLGDELSKTEEITRVLAKCAITIRGHRFLGEKEFEIQHADQLSCYA